MIDEILRLKWYWHVVAAVVFAVGTVLGSVMFTALLALLLN